MTIHEVMARTDWALLAKQKQALIAAVGRSRRLDGLLNWIDAIQDAAEQEHYPVVFLSSEKRRST
jgi:hypothetical protein